MRFGQCGTEKSDGTIKVIFMLTGGVVTGNWKHLSGTIAATPNANSIATIPGPTNLSIDIFWELHTIIKKHLESLPYGQEVCYVR